MRRSLIGFAFLLAGACAPTAPARPVPVAQLPDLNTAAVLNDIKKLSSDEFEGRLPGTKGEQLTVAYLIDQFKAAGLQPGNPDGSWTQKVPLVGLTPEFSGPLVVSMRPIPRGQIVRAVQVTSRFPATHGAPVHIGAPEAIGIRDLARPDFGDPVEVRRGEEPVFWACGVTPQAVALSCRPSLMITHAPGHMFITDQRDADYAVL